MNSNDRSIISAGPEDRVPYVREYLGFWLLEERAFVAGVELARKMDIAAHLRDERIKKALDEAADSKRVAGKIVPQADVSRVGVSRGYSYDVIDDVAVVSMAGTLMKHLSSMDEGTSTVMLRNTVRQMKNDPKVQAAILVIDSPGGTVSGAYDLADDIAALNAAKPTYAYIEDLGASAAYLQASQTRGISANRNALVGSIGTYGVVYDYSKMFEQEGVKAIVISSGGFKGAGVPGTEITDEQVNEWQKGIDALNAQFIDAVSKGRRMSSKKVSELADGRVHIAAEAKGNGLIDQVESLDQLFARVSASTQHKNNSTPANQRGTYPARQRAEIRKDQPMAPNEDEQPATIAELKATFADDPGFALEAAEQAMTLKEAKAEYFDRQHRGETKPKPPGTDGVNDRGGTAGSPRDGYGSAIGNFNALVDQEQVRHPSASRKACIIAVCRKHPDAHEAYLLETNQGSRQQELIRDHFKVHSV